MHEESGVSGGVGRVIAVGLWFRNKLLGSSVLLLPGCRSRGDTKTGAELARPGCVVVASGTPSPSAPIPSGEGQPWRSVKGDMVKDAGEIEDSDDVGVNGENESSWLSMDVDLCSNTFRALSARSLAGSARDRVSKVSDRSPRLVWMTQVKIRKWWW